MAKTSIFGKDKMSLLEKGLNVNWGYILLICMIATVGFLALYSAAGGSLYPWALKHAIRFAVGLCGLFVVAFIDIRYWLKMICFLILSYLCEFLRIHLQRI